MLCARGLSRSMTGVRDTILGDTYKRLDKTNGYIPIFLEQLQGRRGGGVNMIGEIKPETFSIFECRSNAKW